MFPYIVNTISYQENKSKLSCSRSDYTYFSRSSCIFPYV